MSSYLTFTSPTTDDPKRLPIDTLERDEFEYLAMALVQRLREGSMPPDDGYWWTRALCAEPYMRAFPDIDVVLADQTQAQAEPQCRVA